MKNKFYDTDIKEQETIINIDYSRKIVSIYTSREVVAKRIKSRLGDPTLQHFTNKKISGAIWEIPFTNSKYITLALSRPTLIGNMK